MKTSTKRIFRFVSGVLVCAALLVPPSANAGTGASYASIKRAIDSNNVDTILSEVERAEKLPCGACIGLVEDLVDHPHAKVRDVAGWWLAKRAARLRVRDAMIVRLQSADTTAARNAAEVLGRFMHPDALMALEAAVHDDTLGDEARAAAATAIGTIGDYRGKAMLEAGATSESPAVRAASAAALREIRGNFDAVALVDLLADTHEAVVHQAVLTVGALRETSAVDRLIAVVLDETQPVKTRKHAAWALGKIGDGQAKDTLRTVSEDDPSMLVRGAARSAYQALL